MDLLDRMTATVMAFAEIYDSGVLASILGKDNYNIPRWRKKEQPFEGPVGSKSFHSYNGRRRLLTL